MFPAFLDTCSLYGAYLCDSLLRLAEAGTYRPLWSADVLLDQLDLYPGHTVGAVRDQARSYSAPAMSIEDLLGRLAAAGVPKFAAEARRHLWPAGPADS